jgi:rhamnose transport system ATP-binding protein
MSDRIVVMREGRIVEVVENRNLSAETLVMAAAGIAERAA